MVKWGPQGSTGRDSEKLGKERAFARSIEWVLLVTLLLIITGMYCAPHPTPGAARRCCCCCCCCEYSVSPCQLDYDHPHRPLPPGIPPSFAHHGREREPSISSPSTRFISQVLAVPRSSRRAESSPNNIELSLQAHLESPFLPSTALSCPALPCPAPPCPCALLQHQSTWGFGRPR